MGLFLVLGKLVGAVREMAIAYRYGIGETVDAYLFVASLYGWLPALLGGALAAALVPLVKRESARGASTDRLLGELLGVALLVGTSIAVVVALLAPVIAASLPDAAQLDASALTALVRDLAPLLPLGLAIVPLSIALLARDRHANTLFEALPAAAVCVAVLAWPVATAAPLAAGHVGGTVAQTVALLLALAATGRAPRPRLSLQAPQWPAFGRAVGILLAGQCLLSLVTLVDQVIALSQGPGSLATFGYATRVLALLTGLGATVVVRAVLPVLADLTATGREAEAAGLVRRWAAVVTVAAACAAVVGNLVADDLVRMLFRRGAFTEADVHAVADVLRAAMTQLPFYLGGVVLVQFVACQSRHLLIAGAAAASLVVKLLANWLLVPHLGLIGLMFGTAAMYAFSACVFWIATTRNPT